jgi:chromosome segregation ATPase|nr:MAG TPA: SECRETED 45 KDA PROTEIN CYCLE, PEPTIDOGLYCAN, CHAP, CELL [Caudoviricetes sp.]
MIKNMLILFLLLAGLFLLPSLSGSSVQAEVMYQISEAELTRLEQNLQTLANHSEQKQQLLTEQQTQLTEAQNQLKVVNEQLKISRQLNDQTQKSLQKAEESLNEYEKEAERKIRIKTRQRNLWILISGGLLAGLVTR